MNSCLYECEIGHIRNQPRVHKFRHKHFMALIDLSELDQLSATSALFGRSFSPYSFRERDYLPNPNVFGDLPHRVRHYVKEAGCSKEIYSIRLLTNLRVCGYDFNPISLFFCFGENGEAVSCLAEVGNTFGEKKAYVLPCKQNHNGFKRFQATLQKLFYVSPFTRLEQYLRFDVPVPNEILNVHVDTLEGQEVVVAASLVGKRLDWNSQNLLDLSLRFPLAPFRVIALIHIHALMLWLKKVPHHEKGESTELQQDVLRPHKSIVGSNSKQQRERDGHLTTDEGACKTDHGEQTKARKPIINQDGYGKETSLLHPK